MNSAGSLCKARNSIPDIRDSIDAVIPDSKLRSSFSIAFCRHLIWNSHSPQCRFRTRSGGEELDNNATIVSVRFRTSPASAEVFTFNVE